MSDTPVPTYRIEHLKSAENYPTWSVQIKDILTEAGLFDIVSGATPRPALQLIMVTTPLPLTVGMPRTGGHLRTSELACPPP